MSVTPAPVTAGPRPSSVGTLPSPLSEWGSRGPAPHLVPLCAPGPPRVTTQKLARRTAWARGVGHAEAAWTAGGPDGGRALVFVSRGQGGPHAAQTHCAGGQGEQSRGGLAGPGNTGSSRDLGVDEGCVFVPRLCLYFKQPGLRTCDHQPRCLPGCEQLQTVPPVGVQAGLLQLRGPPVPLLHTLGLKHSGWQPGTLVAINRNRCRPAAADGSLSERHQVESSMTSVWMAARRKQGGCGGLGSRAASGTGNPADPHP